MRLRADFKATDWREFVRLRGVPWYGNPVGIAKKANTRAGTAIGMLMWQVLKNGSAEARCGDTNFMMNIHLHDMCEAMAPPTIGPRSRENAFTMEIFATNRAYCSGGTSSMTIIVARDQHPPPLTP